MASHPCINLESKQGGRETVIAVRGWPGHGYQGWQAYTADHVPVGVIDAAGWNPEGVIAKARRKKGRAIYACGWHGLKKDRRVAQLLLHVEGNAPLRVQLFDSSADLTELDRYSIRNFLLSCAVDIAKALQGDLGINDGWLEWRVPAKRAQEVVAASPGFVIVRRRRRPRLRGTDVILRRES